MGTRAIAGDDPASQSKFTIFHLRDGRDPVEAGVMSMGPPSAIRTPTIEDCLAACINDRADLVFSGGGLSLVRCWIKAEDLLPRHTHDCDCLHYVIAGSLTLGIERLEAGDGIFILADTAYAYTAGEEGVEVIHFRASESFDLKMRTSEAFWTKALACARKRRGGWIEAPRPSSVRGA